MLNSRKAHSIAALTCSHGYVPVRRPRSQPAATAPAQASAISVKLHRSTVAGSSSGKPQNHTELVVRSASRRVWNSYVAHQPSGLTSRNGRLSSSHTPPVPAATFTAPRGSRACSRSSSSGSAKKPG